MAGAASAPQRYSTIALGFHWVIAALIAVQFTLGLRADQLPLGLDKLALLTRHKSLGITVLVLAVGRLAWRLTHRPPPLPAAMGRVESALASAVHLVLYGLVFALPMTGWLMSSAANYTVTVFGYLTLPNLIAPDPTLLEQLKLLHRLLALALAVLVAVHLAAALRHHFLLKDDILTRMLPRRLRGPRP